MATKGFDATGFRRGVQALERQVRGNVRAAMDRGSNALADQIRQNAPVDTGALRDSVKVQPVRSRKGRLRQEVQVGGADVRPHAAQVEYGTSAEPPNPFIRRAIDAKEPEMVGLIETALTKG